MPVQPSRITLYPTHQQGTVQQTVLPPITENRIEEGGDNIVMDENSGNMLATNVGRKEKSHECQFCDKKYLSR